MNINKVHECNFLVHFRKKIEPGVAGECCVMCTGGTNMLQVNVVCSGGTNMLLHAVVF